VAESTKEKIIELLASEGDDRVCRDIPDEACREEPRNFSLHISSLSLTKIADGLIDPKLILSWLITALGAPTAFVALLVPIRESGSLLPQLFTAGHLRSLPVRKYLWSVGSFLQGLCAVGIAFSAILLEGRSAGIAILALLGVLAIARSVCSVTYKDVLGKTVSKSRRGAATGTAATIAALFVILFAITLSLGIFDRMNLVLVGLVLAGVCWSIAAVLFSKLVEVPGATEGGGTAFTEAIKSFGYLKSDPQLLLFIVTRALLTATALAPPLMVAISVGEGSAGTELGFLVLASAAAGLSSSYVWGRLSDRSSRLVLAWSGFIAAVILLLTVAVLTWFAEFEFYLIPMLLFGLMISYQGVRLGRSVHLVDMATENTRAAYVALSNTLIGVALLASGAFSVLGAFFGLKFVLVVFALMCALAGGLALRLKEVQRQ